MTVAHGGAVEFQIQCGQEVFQPHVAHDRGGNPIAAQQALFVPIACNNGQNRITVNNGSVFITQNQTVGIAVQGNAQIGFFGNDAGRELLRVQTPALGVDVKPIGGNAHGANLCPQFPKNGGGDFIGGPMGAIHHQPQAIQAEAPGKGHFYGLNIAPNAVFHAAHPAHGVGLRVMIQQIRVHQAGNFGFILITELKSIGSKKFHPIVVIGIVRR